VLGTKENMNILNTNCIALLSITFDPTHPECRTLCRSWKLTTDHVVSLHNPDLHKHAWGS
jgi:hypothetical protein